VDNNKDMSNKTFILLGTVFFILVVAIGLYLFSQRKTPASEAPVENNFLQASTSATRAAQKTLTIATKNGNDVLIVKDFIHNGETILDIENPDTYILAGSLGYCLADGTCPAGAKSEYMNVTYNQTDQSFAISLLQEPLGNARKIAQEFLMSRLGITKLDTCALRAFVGTPYTTNENYSDTSVGFDGCSDAIPLP
jgi:hypothetical protein